MKFAARWVSIGRLVFSGKARKGALREIFLCLKISLRDDIRTFRLYEKYQKRRFFCYFLRRAKSNQKARARTRQKLPVASFGVSETAETGSIVSGREQDDHVSRSRLRPATSVQNSERGDYLLSRKLCAYQGISTKICNLVPYSSEYFEPVRDGGFTA